MDEHLKKARECLATAIRLLNYPPYPGCPPPVGILVEAREEMVAAQQQYELMMATLPLLPGKVVVQ